MADEVEVFMSHKWRVWVNTFGGPTCMNIVAAHAKEAKGYLVFMDEDRTGFCRIPLHAVVRYEMAGGDDGQA